MSRRKYDPRRGQPMTADQRAHYARERKAVVGKLISQEGFEGALVVEHIRGSQYLLRMPDGTEVFASHKKDKNNSDVGAIVSFGWRLWE